MRKKISSTIIVLVIVTAVIMVFAAWSKLMHKQYADNALTIAVTLQIGSITLAIGWFLYTTLHNVKQIQK